MTKATVRNKKAKKLRLPWKYCECGCKGHDVKVGSVSLWMFNDLAGGFHLFEGHGGRGPPIGTYKSFEEADEAARRHAKPEFKKLNASMKQLSASF